MNTLIKKSDYYYVIDDKSEIKEGDFLQFTVLKDNSPFISKWINDDDLCKEYNHGVVIKSHFNILGEKGNKVIATTNPSLPLPQITNVSNDMIGKEVEIEFKSYPDDKDMIKGWKEVIIKPINKGTSTNETLEEIAEKLTILNYSNDTLKELNLETIYQRIYKFGVIAGYKHCEKVLKESKKCIYCNEPTFDNISCICNQCYNKK